MKGGFLHVAFQIESEPASLPHSFAMRKNLLLRVSLGKSQHLSAPFRKVTEFSGSGMSSVSLSPC